MVRRFDRRHLILSLLWMFSLGISAQEDIRITEFYYDETDLTPMQHGTIVEDSNGNKCALIKIQTTETGFSFELGSNHVVKDVRQKTGQIWVYVPNDAKKISIYHQRLGSLIDYRFANHIESGIKDGHLLEGRTYVMRLSTNKIFVNNYDDSRKQTLSIKVSPANANFMLNGMSVPLDENGTAEQVLSFGVYTYKVEAFGYRTKDGQISIDDTVNAQSLEINDLKPIMGDIEIKSEPADADVTIDGKPMGRTPRVLLKELMIGSHTIQISKENYKPESRTVEISENEVAQLSVVLNSIGNFVIETKPTGAKMTFDGKDVGNSPYRAELASGDYDILITKKGYYDYRQNIHLDSSKPDVLISLEKEYYKPTNYYIGGGMQVGAMMAAGGFAGAYINKINVEASFLIGLSESEDIFWNWNENASNEATCYSYKPTYIGGNVGYGVDINHRFRITPKVGAGIIQMKGTLKHDGGTGYFPESTFAIAGKVGCSVDYAVTSRMAVFAKPELSVAVTKKDLFNKISELSSKVKGFGTGFNAIAGIYFYF